MGKQSKYTRELLQPIVEQNTTMSDVLRALNLSVSGGNFRHIKSYIKILGIDTSHFKGRSWAKGETQNTHNAIAKSAAMKRVPDNEVFTRGSTYTTSKLFRRLIAIGWRNECCKCGIAKWMGAPLRIQVDHINGDHTDHRIENLRLLCPNCHSQTNTFCKGEEAKFPDREENSCKDCGAIITMRAVRCSSCAAKCKNETKIEWPSTKVLRQRLEQISYLELGRQLGVSDNAIRKRLKNHR